MGAAATTYLVTWRQTPVGYRDPVTSLEIILVLAGVPLAILALLALLTLRPHFARRPRYRPGEEWNHPPVLWTANPEALGDVGHRRAGAARGGARGHW